MAVTVGCKELKTSYPIIDGLIAETTTQQGHIINLEAENSIIPQRERRLIE
jgi:hypothetical protein